MKRKPPGALSIQWGTVLLVILSLIPGHAADRPKVGLVLSGGGARGFAHVGVLKMLDSLDIPVDCIAGTSMGGIVGALYAIGYSGRDLEALANRSDWMEMFTDRPSRSLMPYLQKKEAGRYQIEFGMKGFKPVPPSGLIFGQKISLLFASLTFPYERVTDFDRFPIPFRCVASDLIRGERVVLKSGSLSNAMRATMAIPTVFSAVEWGDSLLVDGGLLDNLPVDVVKAMGADVVIAVDVGYPLRDRASLQSVLAVMEQSMAMLGIERRKENLRLIDAFIQPDLSGFTMADFGSDRIRKIIQRGDQAANLNRDALVRLKERLDFAGGRDTTENPAPGIRDVQRSGQSAVPSLGNPRQPGSQPVVQEIVIQGNHFLPRTFVSRLLGYRTGDRLETDDINRRIMAMYGYGYFESICYDVDPIAADAVRFTLSVKESPFKKLRLGIRYDELHKLVAAVDFQHNNVVIPGLRLENELQFAGLLRWKTKAFYPSLNLATPAYPFVDVNAGDVPTHLFNQDGEQIARYNHRSVDAGIGLGFLAGKHFNLEIAYRYEAVRIHPDIALPDPIVRLQVHDDLRMVRAAVDIDALDDVFVPRRGFVFNAAVEKSFSALRSDVPYSIFDVSFDLYGTFRLKHTFRFFGFACNGSSGTPVYKFYNRGRPESFIGMQYDQLISSRMGIARWEYRYQHKKDIFLRLMANTAFGFGHLFPAFEHHERWLWGAGIGLTLLSPVGPIDVAYGRGSRSHSRHRDAQDVFYFSMGYKF
jgi:NTE family protein